MKKKAVVLGTGISGKSAYQFLSRRGYYVMLLDPQKKSLSIKRSKRCGSCGGVTWDSKKSSMYLILQKKVPNFLGEAELGLKEITKTAKIIAVTGTNGKQLLPED